jgi:hypothetical protein
MNATFYNEALDARINFNGEEGFGLLLGDPRREEDITDEEILSLYNTGAAPGWVRV